MDDLEDVWSRLKPRSQDGDTTIGTRLRNKKAASTSHQQRKKSQTNKHSRQKNKQSERTYGDNGRYANSIGSKSRGARDTTSTRHLEHVLKRVRSLPQAVRRSTTKKARIGVSLMIIATVAIFGAARYDTPVDPQEGTPQALGTSNQQQTRPQGEDSELPVVEPSFDLLVPSNRSIDDFRVVLLSPEGNAPAYTYIDELSDASVQVTQQQTSEIPNYKGVDAIATDFQATNALRVDEVVVYYGVNDRSGVQSVITEKGEILVLILSPRQLPEEVWVRYIAALQ